MSQKAVEAYFKHVYDIRSSGACVDETSLYAPLSNLLDEVGKRLKPRVRCFLGLKNTGSGYPDGGLFTADQFENLAASNDFAGQKPKIAAIEVKSAADTEEVLKIAVSDQVQKYKTYGYVLVTNYRDFQLVTWNDNKTVFLERYTVASSEKTFWSLAKHSKTSAQTHGQALTEFLQLVMQRAAPIHDSEQLAWFLAFYAKQAKSRLDGIPIPALKGLRDTLEDGLGLKFAGERGEHFFRSSLIQTLFYGLFSAWVVSHTDQKGASKKFDYRLSPYYLKLPVIRKLFYEIAEPGQLKEFNLPEVLQWAEESLNRTDSSSFFQQFEKGTAIQYFYEPFLKAFDPELRKQLGVWYTPKEVVSYMVARVDEFLKNAMKRPLGLADENVYVLDPCCGTGTFLLETLETIYSTMKKNPDAMTKQKVKKAAMTRVFGFELLPAPFIISHLQLGLFLSRQVGAPLSNGNERVGVYLTNSLTGWEEGSLPPLPWQELEDERTGSGEVKKKTTIIVVIGNPPYNSKPKKGQTDVFFSAAEKMSPSITSKVYKENLSKAKSKGGWGITKSTLDDLYVRFFRLAERKIVEKSDKAGLICYISNFSFLSGPSFVVMRKKFLNEFNEIWIDSLNGDSRETGKLTPEGKPDPSVFSTASNKQGIRVGTAVSLLVKNTPQASEENANEATAIVRYRDFWGTNKRADLLSSLDASHFDESYQVAAPSARNRYSFRSGTVSSAYTTWPDITELTLNLPFNGPIERRGNSLVVFQHEANQLTQNLAAYLDKKKTDDAIASQVPKFMKSAGEFSASTTRKDI